MYRNALGSIICCVTLSLVGCASSPTSSIPHKEDPFESFNRKVYGFNKVLDNGLMKPVSYAYGAHTPKAFQLRVHNFFANVKELTTIVNDVLQAKFSYVIHDTSRFIINSTIGLGGLFDPAEIMGLERHQEDFGQTLQTWGMTSSPYLVMPILGPSTIRDTVGIFVDYYAFSAWPYVKPDSDRARLQIANIIDLRANQLSTTAVIEAIGVDEYVFVRDTYLQRRQSAALEDKTEEEAEAEDPFEDEDWVFME